MCNVQTADRIVQIEELNNTEDVTVRKTALWKRIHIIDRCPNVQKVREIVCKLRQQDNAYGKPRKIIITAFMPLTVAIYKMWLMWVLDQQAGEPPGTTFADAKFTDFETNFYLLNGDIRQGCRVRRV
jgi:hypothetical protein